MESLLEYQTSTRHRFMSKTSEGLILGCDPELALIGQSGASVCAADIIRMPDHFHGIVGVDGAGTAAELRPGVAKRPVGLVAKCAQAVGKLQVALRGELENGRIRKVIAGSYAPFDNPLGGHIHVGGNFIGTAELFATWADLLALTWWWGIDTLEH